MFTEKSPDSFFKFKQFNNVAQTHCYVQYDCQPCTQAAWKERDGLVLIACACTIIPRQMESVYVWKLSVKLYIRYISMPSKDNSRLPVVLNSSFEHLTAIKTKAHKLKCPILMFYMLCQMLERTVKQFKLLLKICWFWGGPKGHIRATKRAQCPLEKAYSWNPGQKHPLHHSQVVSPFQTFTQHLAGHIHHATASWHDESHMFCGNKP